MYIFVTRRRYIWFYSAPKALEEVSVTAGTVASSRYGGFVERLFAYIIDGVIIGVAAGVLTGIATATESLGLSILASLIVIVGSIGYFVYFWGTTGQTIGKKVLGLKVVGPNGEQNGIGYGTAFLRLIGYSVSGFLFYLGFLWIIWDPNKQGFHDKIAKTHVIKV